jgi:serine/threonine-protein kinase
MDERRVDPFAWEGATLDGKYTIEEMVGEGGFGVVYRGHHLGFEEKVAVKCLRTPPTLVGEQRQRFFDSFMAEGRLLHKLSRSTAGIVQALDVGGAVSPNKTWTPYLVLEWLEGKTLEQDFHARLQAGIGGRSLSEAIDLLEPAAWALALVHEQGVAHRDIKPANLFLANVAGRTMIKVLDFGIAKVISDSKATRAFEATGRTLQAFTPRYGAPEQFSRRYGSTGPWSDVFALALVLVEAVALRSGLQGEDAAELFVASADTEHRPTLKNCGVEMDGRVDAVLEKALAVDPKERYRNAAEFWEAMVAAAAESGLHRSEALSSEGRARLGSVAFVPQPAAETPPARDENAGAIGIARSVAKNVLGADITHTPSVLPTTKPTPARLAIGLGIATAAFATVAAVGVLLWSPGNNDATAGIGSRAGSDDVTAQPAGSADAPARVQSVVKDPEKSAKSATSAREGFGGGYPGRKISAGRSPKLEIWVDGFEILQRDKSLGLSFLAAQAHCADAGRYLCTEVQWARACVEQPFIGEQASWTVSAERGGVVTRGGRDCQSQGIVGGGSVTPERGGLCCERTVGLDIKGYNAQTLSTLNKRLLALEGSINRRSVEDFVNQLDSKVKIEGTIYSSKNAGKWLTQSLERHPDQWRVLDVCEVTVDTRTYYKRTRSGRRKKVEVGSWSADCRETRHRAGQVAVMKTTYVLNQALKFALIGRPKPLRDYADP